MTQFSRKRLKETTSVSINKYLLEKAKDLVDAGYFGSVSDVISTALAEFFTTFKPPKEAQGQKYDEQPHPTTPNGGTFKKVVFK